jgi:hypothetical protein
LTFLSLIDDRSVPTSVSEFDEVIDSVTEYLREGKAVVVHCWGGVGRSSIVRLFGTDFQQMKLFVSLKNLEAAKCRTQQNKGNGWNDIRLALAPALSKPRLFSSAT